ncbi:MAG: 50S ribosomal protein L13 [Verrucomicrobia bacterium]|nr:50S ribosomal protein L13 [Verrucomicrobiota bacterium]
MKTTLPKDPGENRPWIVIDANGQHLGRLAVHIANVLRGKNKPTFTPHVDTGDFVVVVNAEKVTLTGKKEEQKIYQNFSGWRGGLKETKAGDLRARHPERMIQHAVKGMLPKNNLSRQMFSRLKVYVGAEHPHAAQQPHVKELA